ncbi:MAG TPA: polyprenol monophosphomannose synthase [Myxococcota bacterium]|nr:polyprenol monophosphomannose synthase [Myxococcota bacterium]
MTLAGPTGEGVLVCVPTFNERENLPRVIDGVHRAIPSAGVLVVDDASPDGTGEIASAIAARDPRVQVLSRPGRAGLGAAYLHAFDLALAAGWSRVVQIDADLSHDPSDIPRLLGSLDAGAGLAIGSRYCPGGSTPGWSWTRRQLSRAGGAYARALLSLPVVDPTSGFRAWSAEALRGVRRADVRARGYGFQIEMAFRAHCNGVAVVEVPVRFVEREAGVSKMSAGIVLEALRVTWWLRQNVRGGAG